MKTSLLINSTLISRILGCTLILFIGCKQQTTKINIDKTETKKKYKLLENFKKSMSQIGETAICDTSIYNKCLYFDNWFGTTSKLICLRNFADDTLSIISFNYISEDGAAYISDLTPQNAGVFSYPHKLHKVVKEIPRSRATAIFAHLDKLVKNKKIAPFGSFASNEIPGCGGEWLVYFDGKDVYECQGNKIDSLAEFLNSNIDLERIQEELFESS